VKKLIEKKCDNVLCRYYDVETGCCDVDDSVFEDMIENMNFDVCSDGHENF
jgi:hypothetical protein